MLLESKVSVPESQREFILEVANKVATSTMYIQAGINEISASDCDIGNDPVKWRALWCLILQQGQPEVLAKNVLQGTGPVMA